MKTTWHLCLGLAAMFFIAADKVATQSIDLGDLTIDIPASWERLPDFGAILTARTRKKDPGETFLENVRLEAYEMPKLASVDAVLAAQSSPTAMKGFRLVGKGELTGGQQRILWYAITAENKKDAPVGINYMMVRGQKAYFTHFMVASDKWEQHKPEFDAIVRSVTFRGNPGVADGEKLPPILPANRDAFENGKQIGQITFDILIAVVVLYGILAVIRRMRR